MKNLLISAILLAGVLFASGCDFVKEKVDDSYLGGDPGIAMNTVGNKISTGSLTLGNSSIPLDAELTVLENDNGIVTGRLVLNTGSLRQNPTLATILNAVVPRYVQPDGNIQTDLKFKSTSNGIQDFVNVDGKAHTLIRYNDGPGQEYTIQKSNGRTLTREIVAKSDQDDFPYGFMDIKTTTVESEINVGGIRKIVYRANHKFGIVHAQAIMEDGSTMSTYLYSVQ